MLLDKIKYVHIGFMHRNKKLFHQQSTYLELLMRAGTDALKEIFKDVPAREY